MLSLSPQLLIESARSLVGTDGCLARVIPQSISAVRERRGTSSSFSIVGVRPTATRLQASRRGPYRPVSTTRIWRSSAPRRASCMRPPKSAMCS